MKRYSVYIMGLTIVLTISIGNSGCTKEKSFEQIDEVQTRMVELENAVLLKHFNTTPASKEISNKAYFTIAAKLKTSVNAIERDKIEATLCRYNLSDSKFSDQIKDGNVQLTDKEQVIYESFLSSFTNSEEHFIAICEFYINEVSCMNLDSKIKSDFVDRISFFRDMLIYVDYETYSDQLTYDDLLKSLEEIPFDDCYDSCMTEEIKHATSSTIRKVLFLLSLPVRTAEFMVSCVGDCI